MNSHASWNRYLKSPVKFHAVLLCFFLLPFFVACDREVTNDSIQHSKASKAKNQNKEIENPDSQITKPNLQTQSSSPKNASSKETNVKITLVYSDNYILQIDTLAQLLKTMGLSHPFDYKKYQKIHRKLVKEKLIEESQVHQPKALTDEQIRLVQSDQFLKNIKDIKKVFSYLEVQIPMETKIGGVSIKSMLERMDFEKKVMIPFRTNAAGTVLAAEKALESGIGINLGGGFHHAKPNKGEGFCIFADVPIAIRQLQKEKKIKKALIIDVDAHKGNGTAYCLKKDPTTFTFSMHEKNNYPYGDGESDLDVDLDSGIGDKDYLAILEKNLPTIFEKANADIVFIVGGCDTLKPDPLTDIHMTVDGVVKRDQMIVDFAVKKKIPVVMTLSGGYSPNAWECQYESVKNLIDKYGVSSKTIKNSN